MNRVPLSAMWDAVQSVLASPAQNPTLTLLVTGIAVLTVLIVLLLLLASLTPGRRKVVKVRRVRRSVPQGERVEGWEPKDQKASAQAAGGSGDNAAPRQAPAAAAPKAAEQRVRKSRPGLSRKTAMWLTLGLVAAAVLSAYYITGSDTYCASTCHANDASVSAAGEIHHARCVACHERPGIAAIPDNLLARGSMVVRRLSGSTDSVVTVDSRACARCHSGEMRKTVESGTIRMSHAEPYAAGYTCVSCHLRSGHSRARVNNMSRCVVCHDAKRASADCVTCHRTDPLAATSSESTGTIGSGKIVYPMVDLPAKKCDGCHDLAKECDTCHGVRMPHPDSFITAGGHAVTASFEGKNKCFKCHATTECSKCHSLTGHQPGWKLAHQKFPWDSEHVGCTCHTGGCYLCHSRTGSHALLR